MLKRTYSMLLGISIELVVVHDSKDLYVSLAKQRQSVDSSVCAEVNFIRYQFETSNADRICWIPGRFSIAEPGTKTDSSLIQAILLLLFSRKLPFGFSELEVTKCKKKSLGQLKKSGPDGKKREYWL